MAAQKRNSALLAKITISIAQTTSYLAIFADHKDKLEDLSDDIEDRADDKFAEYQSFRNNDPQFYEEYKNYPEYQQCASNIARSKGRHLRTLGRKLRRNNKAIPGYSQAKRIPIVSSLAKPFQFGISTDRLNQRVVENKRKDEFIFKRWAFVISAPINKELNSGAIGSVILSETKALKQAGRGFNSGALALGDTIGNFKYGN